MPPAAYRLVATGRPLQHNFDVLLAVLLAGAIGGMAWLVVDARRRGVPWRLAAAAALDLLTGVAAAALSIAHAVAVTVVAIRRAGAFAWDFRFASLLLVGIAIALPGLACLGAARRLTFGDALARRQAIVGSIMLVAVNAVLVPVQGAFAGLLGGLALANLISLLVGSSARTARA